jgi:hypothetical protein
MNTNLNETATGTGKRRRNNGANVANANKPNVQNGAKGANEPKVQYVAATQANVYSYGVEHNNSPEEAMNKIKKQPHLYELTESPYEPYPTGGKRKTRKARKVRKAKTAKKAKKSLKRRRN